MTTKEDSKSLSRQRFSRFAQGYVTSKGHASGEELDRLVEIAQPQPDWLMLDVATGGGHTALKFAPLVAQVVATDITPKMLVAAQEFLTSQGAENVTFELADAEDLPFETDELNNEFRIKRISDLPPTPSQFRNEFFTPPLKGERRKGKVVLLSTSHFPLSERGTATKGFDLVTCRIAPHHFTDCNRFVQEGARMLKSGGLLLVQDHVSPEDEQCARYVNTFQKLRDPSHNRSYSESEWTRMFQKAGLKVEHTEHIIKRHEFFPWVERQKCTPEVIQQLVGMVKEASPAVLEWMQPQDFDTPQATFADRHIIIAGRKN